MGDRTVLFILLTIIAILLPAVIFLWWPEEKEASEKKTVTRDYKKLASFAKSLLSIAACIAAIVIVPRFFNGTSKQLPPRTVIITKEVEKRDVALGNIWWCKTRDICQQNHEIVTKFYNDNETMMITAKYIDPKDGVEKTTQYVWAKRDAYGTWGNPDDGGKWRLQYDAMNKVWIGLVSDHTDINKFIQLNMTIV